MQNTDNYYRESGKMGIASILGLAIAGTAVAGLLGTIYAYATFYIPFIYLNFIMTAIVGAGVGIVIGKVAYYTKARNRKMIVLIGGVFGLIAIYFAWVAWFYVATDSIILSFNVGELIDTIKVAAEVGVWEIFGSTPTGTILYLIWALEAFIIIGASVLVTLATVETKPYCEACDKWSEANIHIESLSAVTHPAELIDALERNNQTELFKLVKVDPMAMETTRVRIFSCSNCGNTYYLTVEMILTTLDEDGKREDEETTLVGNLIITHSAYLEISKWKEQLSKKKTEDPVEEDKVELND